MYTIAMMMAMTTAPEVPQFNGFFRDMFQGSCHGQSDRRSSCTGCCGGSGVFNGGIRDFFLGGRGCCGGGCCGGGGCNGRDRDALPRRQMDQDDRGAVATPRPNGCYASMPYSGCSGSCNGGIIYAGTSCTGGLPSIMMPGDGYAMPTEAAFNIGTPDCNCGSVPAVFGSMPSIPRIGSPAYDYTPIENPRLPMGDWAQPREAPGIMETRDSRKTPMQSEPDSTRGTVTVKMPADAKLLVEGKTMSVKDGERTFVTPPLPKDKEAQYSFKIEFIRDGEVLSIEKKVYIRAGRTTMVNFNDILGSKLKSGTDMVTKAMPDVQPEPKLNSNTTARAIDEVPTVKPPVMDHAKFTVKLPEGAALYVNGAKNERTELTRLFTTPTLAPGKSYQYVMKAEITRNGLPEYQEQKIDFQAGDNLTIDFTNLSNTERTAKK